MDHKTVSRKVQKLIDSEMAAGRYRSENDLLVNALQALAERRSAIAGIQRGLADLKAGRHRSRKQFKHRLLKRHPGLADQV